MNYLIIDNTNKSIKQNIHESVKKKKKVIEKYNYVTHSIV